MKAVGLNPAPLADIYSLLYLYKRADKTFVADDAAIKIDRLNDGNVFTKRYIDNSMPAEFLALPQLLANPVSR